MNPSSAHDGSSTSASPPVTTGQSGTKAPAKISCLACRAAKRKCLTPNALTRCKRCVDQKIECEYQKHRRGRRKKVVEDGGTAPAPAAPGPADPGSVASSSALSGLGSGGRVYPRHRSRSTSRGRSRSPDHHRRGGMLAHDVSDLRSRDDRFRQPEAPRPRTDISFSHVVPFEGDSSPYIDKDRKPVASEPSLALRTDCPDPVLSGFLTETDAYELFDFYFNHLNVTVAILDPVLHTVSYCREKSPLLFSAILAVTARIAKPKAYEACLAIANKLVGQAVEYGLCSVEVVQALLLLIHWRKADDGTAWRKAGYAIRMAQELRLHHRAPRPLPDDERQARELLNRERCWLNLILVDYHLAMHHALPRMISEDDVDDPITWIAEHPNLACPGEAVIPPWISFSRMCRLFADMLASMNGSHSNLRSLQWLEMEFKRWHKRWIERSNEHGFMRHQIAMLRMQHALLGFHITEYRLLFTARYRSDNEVLDTSEPSPLSYAFGECVDAALGLFDIFQNEMVKNGWLPVTFGITWVGVAITSVWLIKNFGPMDGTDRGRVVRTLAEAADSMADASQTSDDMSAYTHRLLKHLIGSVMSTMQQGHNGANTGKGSSSTAVTSQAPTMGPPTPPQWTTMSVQQLSSAQQIIQDHLWHPNLFDPIQPQMQPQAQQPLHVGAGVGLGPDALPDTVLSSEVLFPAADDDIWKLIFPL